MPTLPHAMGAGDGQLTDDEKFAAWMTVMCILAMAGFLAAVAWLER